MKHFLKKSLFIVSLIIINPTKIFAAGFAVDAQSAAGLGNSHAGEATGAHDISDSYANPAILSDIKTPQMSFSASYIKVDIDDDNGNGKYYDASTIVASRNNDAGVDAIVPAFHIAAPISQNLTAGLSIALPFALETEYNPNWVGRYWAVDSKIITTNINPMLSYQISPKLSFGGGFAAQYAKARITNMVDIGTAFSQPAGSADGIGKAKGDDWGYGFNLGIKYKFNDKLQAGLGYRSKIQHKITGQVQIDNLGSVSKFSTPFVTPEIANFGLSYQLTPKSQLLYDLAWTRWSRINTLDVNAQSSSLRTSTKFYWRDSFRNSLGFNYQTNNKLQIRTGLAFEQGASGQYRNPRVPEANKTLVSAGFGYKFTKNLSGDLTYMHQFYEKTKNSLAGDGALVPSLQTDYKLKVDVVAVGLKYDF